MVVPQAGPGTGLNRSLPCWLAEPAREGNAFGLHSFEIGDCPADRADDSTVRRRARQLEAQAIPGQKDRVQTSGKVGHQLRSVVGRTVAKARSHTRESIIALLGQSSGQLVSKEVLGQNRELGRAGESWRERQQVLEERRPPGVGQARRRRPTRAARRCEPWRPLTQPAKAGQLDGPQGSEVRGGLELVQGADGSRRPGLPGPVLPAEAR